RLIGKIFKEEGILSRGQCVETSRSAMVGKWIGETEQKCLELIKFAKGGILFIDEIYSLVETEGNQYSNKDFGMKAIDTLMPVLSDPESDVMVIGAGYTSSMKTFLSANPGLASRFPVVLDFEDFTIDQLMEIAVKELEKYEFVLLPEAEEKLRKLFRRAMSVKNFGNGRFVKTAIENHIIPNLCTRVMRNGDLSVADVGSTSLIQPEDIPSFQILFPLSCNSGRKMGFA
nr:AAA family ATPase [Muribaculaceae bacterium]